MDPGIEDFLVAVVLPPAALRQQKKVKPRRFLAFKGLASTKIKPTKKKYPSTKRVPVKQKKNYYKKNKKNFFYSVEEVFFIKSFKDVKNIFFLAYFFLLFVARQKKKTKEQKKKNPYKRTWFLYQRGKKKKILATSASFFLLPRIKKICETKENNKKISRRIFFCLLHTRKKVPTGTTVVVWPLFSRV